MENVSSGKIGRYEIIRVLGRGGMGEVVLAQDQNLGRRVAIKRPFKSAQADGLARFQVEAKAATLRHPNIPAVYEMGVHEDLPFIAMEYVEGETLEKIIESKQEVDLITKLSIIEQVCSALGYAHDNGIIHRDIKPANIIVQPDGTAKIIDFGIAKLADNDPNSGLTKASQLIGSLHYIAPERFYGGGKTDGRVDIFSAGVTLFELLTGKEPFTGGEATASFKIMNEAVTGLGQYLHDYPPALDEIIGKSLAKNPDDRYQTGEDFADALHEVIEELKHSRVSELFNDAERLTTERRFAPALELLDEAIKLDPAHTQARKLRKFVREHQERVRRAERLRECLLKSDEALLNGNFEEALNQLKDAWSLDQASVEIKNKIRELEEKKRRFEISAKALAEADKAKVRGDVTGALRIVTKGLEDDPENKKLLALNAALGRQMEIEAQRGRLLELQENAARALAVRDYDSADKFLGEAVAIDPSNPDTDKLRRELGKARELEQRRAVLEEIQLRANEFMRNDAYEQASDLLHRALERLPHETLLHRLKAEVDAEARKYDVRHIVDLAIAQANELFVNSPFEALAVLQKALDNIPGEERLVAYERSLRQQLETKRSEQLRAETVIKARELMTGRQFGKAIAVLESFQVEFGQNSDVDELLTFARDELVRQQRTEAVSRTLSEARTLIRDGRLDEAVRLLETGQEQTGDASVGALLAESRDQLAATARNLEALFKYVEQLRERDELDEAILLLQDQLAATPGNGNLQQLATSLFAERKQKQVSAIALRAAREAVRENAFKAALESLQTVVNAYGESAEITTAMQDVERQRSTHAAEVIRQSIESARSALLKKDPSGALEVLKTAAPFLEFADAQKQAELQRIGLSVKKALRQAGANTTPSVFDRQPIAQTNRRRIAVWAGIGAVVLAVGVITAVRLARPKTQFQIPKLPLNAIVRVDGVQQKVRLDGSIIAAVKPGIREISIIAPGCDNFVDSIQVEAGRALVDPVKLTCGIVPENQGTLTIPSILPADLTKVRAFVDGQSKGILTAGQSLRLDAGEHHLIYRADGYQDSKDHVVAISKGSVASDPVILEKVPAQSGTLLVHLQNGVTIARMYVNGRSKGEVRSGSRVSLAPATYNLRFESLGCASYEMPEINIDNATETPVDVTCIKVAGASGTLRANVDSVQRGSSFTLIWETQNAKSLQISGVGPVASPSGSRQITPTGPTTYVLTSNGQELAKYAIQVTEPPPPVKVAMFEVSPRSITAGESVNVTWHIENATSVQIPGLGPGNQAAQGTMNVPLTKTTTFQLVVNGQPLAQQSVEVHEAAPPSQKLGDAGGAGGTRPTLMTAEDLKPALRTYQSLLHSAPGKNCKEILAGAKLNATAQNTLNELARNWCSEAKSFTVEEKCAAQPGGSADAPTLSCQETIQVRPKDGESFPIVAQKVFQLKKTSEGHYKLSGW